MKRISHIVKYRRFGRERWSPLEIGKVDPREMTVKEESVVRGGFFCRWVVWGGFCGTRRCKFAARGRPRKDTHFYDKCLISFSDLQLSGGSAHPKLLRDTFEEKNVGEPECGRTISFLI